VRLRRAERTDVAAVAALERGVFGSEAWSEPAVDAELLGEARAALLAVADDQVVGYVALLVAADTADLTRIAVAPHLRRRGVAGALLAAAMRCAVQQGGTRMVLEVAEDNAAAIAFYEQAGFGVVARRRRYYRNGAAALVMERRLDAPAGAGTA
jgi:ribosomal-protein-alanine acetyltransferase